MLPYTGTYREARPVHRRRLPPLCRTEGRQARRPRDRVRAGGRRDRSPEAATDNMNRLVGREKADVVVGTVHSGVAMAMVKVARDTKTLLIIPNAGANDATGPLPARRTCSARRSRTGRAPIPLGKVMVDAGIKNVVTITWRYTAGAEMIGAFGELHQVRRQDRRGPDGAVPRSGISGADHPQIAQLKPDAVFCFFAGGGAVKFVKDYAAAGLNKTIPLYGAGFLTDGTIRGAGRSRQRASRPRCITPTISIIPANRRLPQSVQGQDRQRRRHLCRAGLRRRAALARYRTHGRGRRLQRARQDDRGDGGCEDRQPARAAWPSTRRTTRSRTSICARCATAATR